MAVRYGSEARAAALVISLPDCGEACRVRAHAYPVHALARVPAEAAPGAAENLNTVVAYVIAVEREQLNCTDRPVPSFAGGPINNRVSLSDPAFVPGQMMTNGVLTR